MTETAPVILLVEDNPRDAELTMLALEQGEIIRDVVLAGDGAEALALLHGEDGVCMPHPPRLVLLDLKLPKIDGIEVLERIRAEERTALLPVVVLSTSAEDRDVQACYERHVNSYVQESVDFMAFRAAIRAIGEYWLALNIGPNAERY